jgi:signal transduction histidine kinase
MAGETKNAVFAGIIWSKKDRIVGFWRVEAREIFGSEIEPLPLEDKIPELLEVLAEALGGSEPSNQAARQEISRASEHGVLRAEQGFDSAQVSREFQVLRRVIRKVCAEEGSPLTEAARNIVAKVIDAAAALGVEWCGRKREEIIRREGAREIAFAVHDFRAPLGAVALAAAELAEAIPQNAQIPAVKESLSLLERNVEQLSVEMEKTMREFGRAFSGPSELNIVKVRIHDIAASAVDLFASQARAQNVTLLNQVEADSEAMAAPDALHRVLANLVGNALRYTRNGRVTIYGFQKNAEVEVVVEDTGIGIVTEKLSSIFEPGIKEANSPGLGFGLAIAKYLMNAQRGRIKIESTLGKGSTITLTLPKPTL